MPAIGVFSDSEGDLALFDAALKLLVDKGATRFLFAGGRYEDLDAWVRWKRDEGKAASDYSQGNFLEDVKRWLIGLEQLERPVAFGHAYDAARKAEELTRLANRVVRTPERGCLQYQDPSVPKKAMDMIGDTLCCVAHDKNDFEKDDMINALVLVHGKEPQPKVVQIGPRYFVSPGRLRGGGNASVGLLELGEGRALSFRAFGMDGAPMLEPQSLHPGAKTKVTVK